MSSGGAQAEVAGEAGTHMEAALQLQVSAGEEWRQMGWKDPVDAGERVPQIKAALYTFRKLMHRCSAPSVHTKW